MSIKIKKKLGEGVNGTVFACKYNGTDAIYKIEKYNNDNTTKSSFIREIEFSKLAKKYPKRFMTLRHHEVINNCDHEQKLPKGFDDWPNAVKKVILKKQKYKYCSVLVYTPVLKYTLKQIFHKLSNRQKKHAMNYLMKSVDILQKAGYVHNDIHWGNVMCDRKVKYWYIIDYGSIWNKKFITNRIDRLTRYEYDHVSLFWFFMNNPIYNYMDKYNLFDHFDHRKFKKVIKHDDRFDEIKKLAPIYAINPKNTWISWYDLITTILHYDLYIKAVGMEDTSIGIKYKNYEQPNKDFLLRKIRKLRKRKFVVIH